MIQFPPGFWRKEVDVRSIYFVAFLFLAVGFWLGHLRERKAHACPEPQVAVEQVEVQVPCDRYHPPRPVVR